MGIIAFSLLLALLAVTAFVKPWIGVVSAYVIAILTPQAIWWWHFQDLRPSFWILVPALVGFTLAMARSVYTIQPILNFRSGSVMLLWIAYALSYFFGPYVTTTGPYRFTDPSWAMETLNKLLILYFLGCMCINDEKKLRILMYGFAGSALYLIYWANDQYLSGLTVGRLAGPVDVNGQGTYSDENSFGLLFVVAQPLLWYLGLAIKRNSIRWALWLFIPFGWHAIFLTASRGALVGLIAVTVLMALRSKRKILSLLLIPAFLVAYEWQAGDLMKSRAETIENYQDDGSASSRVEAWTAAAGMIQAFPLTGVGLASFGPAFPDFSNNTPREAHSTFFQITAESGVLAGSMYLFLVVGGVLTLWRNGNRLKKLQFLPGATESHLFLYYINETVLVGSIGLSICALFLSLQIFEIHYFFFLLAHVVILMGNQRLKAVVDTSSENGTQAVDRLGTKYRDIQVRPS